MQTLVAIRTTSVFRDLDDAPLEALSQAARSHLVRANGFFYHQGEPATTFYLLNQGYTRLVTLAPEGQQATVRLAGPGEALCVVPALSHATYHFSAQAVRDCAALAWPGPTLQTLMGRFPSLALRALQLLADQSADLQQRYIELATERVERRIARVLLRLVRQRGRKVATGVQIDLPLSRQDLADMSGTTLYTVSRTFSRWEALGLLTSGRGHILIRNPHGLTVIAEDLPELSSDWS